MLVIGAGFGGLYAARSLAHHGVHVTLVDRRGFQTFQPLLYQVATGLLPRDVVAYPIHEMDRARAVTADITDINLGEQYASADDGSRYPFDYLIVAPGAGVNFFGVPGAQQFAHPLYTVDDALSIKHALQRLAQTESSIRIAVVGAGPTGVELTGALRDVIDYVLPHTFPKLGKHSIDVHLIDHASAPLAHFSVESQRVATQVLKSAGVHLRLGTQVTEVTADGVVLDSAESLAADLVVWAGGLRIQLPQMRPAPALDSAGRLIIDDTLRLPGLAHTYAIGDAAATTSAPLPQLGSVAKQQGLHAAKSIRRQIHGKEPQAFRYRDLGEMAMIRHGHAVVEMGSHHHEITGAVAFTMWLGLHAALLPDNGDRLDAVHAWIEENLTGRSTFLVDG